MTIDSEKKETISLQINEAFISGTIAIGIGYTQLSELSATIDVPYMSSTMYSKYQYDMSIWIHEVAMEQMIMAGEE